MEEIALSLALWELPWAKPATRTETETVTLLTMVNARRNADVMTAGGRVQCKAIKNAYQFKINDKLVAKVVYEGEKVKEAFWVKNL